MISTAVKPSLSLFCRQGFERINTLPLAGGSGASTSLSTLPTQGRLRYTQHTILCTAMQVQSCFVRSPGTRRYGTAVAQGRVAPHCRFTICLVHRSLDHKGSTPVHNSRSPQRQGRVLHAIGGRPTTADAGAPASPPSTHPKLGVSSRHQEFHSCALKRIFRPFLEDGRSD